MYAISGSKFSRLIRLRGENRVDVFACDGAWGSRWKFYFFTDSKARPQSTNRSAAWRAKISHVRLITPHLLPFFFPSIFHIFHRPPTSNLVQTLPYHQPHVTALLEITFCSVVASKCRVVFIKTFASETFPPDAALRFRQSIIALRIVKVRDPKELFFLLLKRSISRSAQNR